MFTPSYHGDLQIVIRNFMAEEDKQTTEFATPEGEQTIPESDTETDDSADSSSEKTETEKATEEGDKKNTPPEKKPFNEDPEVQSYIERQVNNRLKEVGDQHKKDLDDAMSKVRDEFGKAREENKDQKEKLPKWFGGDQSQWEEFLAFEDARLAKAEERAISRISESRTNEDKAVADATQYMQSEMVAIESDKALNPQGLKFTKEIAEKLLSIVMDTENNGKYPLIDADNHWNYRAGWRILMGTIKPKAPVTDNKEKKKIGAAITSDNKGSDSKPNYKTSKDFRKNRPW